MTELLTAAQMRAIEQEAIEAGEVTGLELMERAGQGVVEAILEWRPELAKTTQRAVVLCGPGNNGGDGFVVARLLKDRGWEVEVFLYGDDAKLPPDAAENARRWRELGEVFPVSHQSLALSNGDIVVDALFGTGLTRPLSAVAGEVIEVILAALVNDLNVKVCAVDTASGTCSDSGATVGEDCFLPDLTVTFHRAKVGHYLNEPAGNDCLSVIDIGLNNWQSSWRSDPEVVRLIELSAEGDHVDLGKNVFDHKYGHGHALILSGGVGKGGAARLAARGALRIGAGLVTLGCPAAALIENAARLDAIMLRPMADPDALAEALTDNRITALCLGPGFGVGDRLRATVAKALAANRPTVLDADALTSFQDAPDTLFTQLHPDCVLTPHEGEFGRLFPDILEKLNAPAERGPAYSKVDATREAAARAGCVVLFKGADTVIAAPDGRCAINSAHYDRAAPWLATAGSGDVLAGFITGLLARGLDPMSAAEAAAWLHVECARKFGPGLIAEDLPEQLPAVFRDLGL